MNIWKVTLVAIVIASCATVFVIKRRADVKFKDQQAQTEKVMQAIAALRAENERLSNQLARIAHTATSAEKEAELSSLHAEAAALRLEKADQQKRKLTNVADATVANSSGTIQGADPEPALRRFAAAKLGDANLMAVAVAKYPFTHDGQFPTNLSEATPLMTMMINNDRANKWTGTNEFELVYHGARESWGSIPWGAVAIIRERHPWKAPSGKWARVYGMGDGSSQVVEANDNFQSWEAMHVIPPALADRK